MPFFGLATTGDLEKKTSCTQIINGIHICSIPKYDTIVEPNDFKFGSVIDSSENVCLHFDHVPDVVGVATAKRISNMIGHGDIPDNYVCFDAAKTTQYFKALVPEAKQLMAKGFLDMVSMDDFHEASRTSGEQSSRTKLLPPTVLSEEHVVSRRGMQRASPHEALLSKAVI